MRIMYDPQVEIVNIEQRLERLGVPVADFVRSAGVHPATWRRWRSGETSPTFTSWRKIGKALVGLESEQPTQAAE